MEERLLARRETPPLGIGFRSMSRTLKRSLAALTTLVAACSFGDSLQANDIQNPSFEEPALSSPDNVWVNGAQDWLLLGGGGTTLSRDGIGVPTPNTDGSQIVFASSAEHRLIQEVGTMDANTTYTLSVDVAPIGDDMSGTFLSVMIDDSQTWTESPAQAHFRPLWDVNREDFTLTPWQWTTVTASFNSADFASINGNTIRVHMYGTNLAYDNVRLTKTLNPTVFITSHPVSQTGFIGESVTLSVEANSTAGAASYQWQKDGVDIPGATSSSLVFNPASESDAGDYTVIVSDVNGSKTSEVATLTMKQPSLLLNTSFEEPALTPTNQWANGVQSWTLLGGGGTTVARAGIPGMEYATDGTQIAFVADGDHHLFQQVGTIDANTTYTFSVDIAPMNNPAGRAEVFIDDTDTWSPLMPQMSFRPIWDPTFEQFTLTPGQWTTVTLTFNSADAPSVVGNNIRVRMSGDNLVYDNAYLTKTANADLVITSQPVSQVGIVGDSVTLSVAADSYAGAATFQWQKGGIDIGGATGSSLSFNPVAAADSGDYTVVITNDNGSLTSDVATLTIVERVAIINPSFEEPALPENGWANNLQGWGLLGGGGTTFARDGIGAPATASDGSQIAFVMDADHHVFQEIGTVDANTIYTLTVDVSPLTTPAGRAEIIIEDSQTWLAQMGQALHRPAWDPTREDFTLTQGEWTTVTVTFDSAHFDGTNHDGWSEPDVIGKTMRIRFSGENLAYDNVQVIKTSAPVITRQPAALVVTEGDSATFAVTATGVPGPTYQWQKDGIDIVGATSASYTIDSTVLGDAGNYSVVLTNLVGSVTSNPASLSVNAIAGVNLSDLTQTYDGSAKSATVSTTPAALAVSVTYDGSASLPINAGSYAVVATVTEPGYIGSNSGTLVIEKAAASVSLSNLEHEFDGSAKAATATTTPSGLPVDVTYNGSSTVPSAVGSYTVLATVNDPNYTAATANGTLVIAPPPPVVADVVISGLSQVFDGAAQPVSVSTTPGGLAVNVTYDGSSTAPTNVGSYAVVATVAEAGYVGSASATLVITPASATISLGDLDQTFDGSPKAASASTTPGGVSVAITYDGSATAPTYAGSYSVAAEIIDPNYTGSATGTLNIAKATANVALGNLSQTFDGSAKSATATTTPEGLAVSLTYEGSASAPSAVGNYAVEATVVDDNYEGSASGTLAITQASAQISLSNLEQGFDGSAKTAGVSTTPEGLAVSVTYDGSESAPTDAGSYAVVATITEAGYTGSANGTLVITPAEASISLSGLTQTFDGSAKSASASTTPGGLSVDIAYDGSADAPTNAGSYAVEATIDDPNYTGSATGTLTIEKATASITLGGLAQQFDGAAKPVSPTTTPEGLSVTVTYDGSSSAPSAVGNYAVSATIADDNYEGSASATLTIGESVAQIILGNFEQQYDGALKGVSVTTIPADLAVRVTYNGSTVSPSEAGSYAVEATITEAGYSGSATGTLVITPATANISLSGLSHTYDGSVKSASASTTPNGVSVAVSYDGSSDAPTEAGSYAVEATVTDPNYTGSASATLTIAKATANVALGALAQEFDGAAKPVSVTTSPEGLSVEVTYDGSASAPSTVGSYAVEATVVDNNYEGSASGTLVISQSTADVVLSNLEQGFDGSAKTVGVSTTPEGLAVEVTYNGSADAPVNAGNYAVVATITEPGYSGAASATLKIAKATATVTLGDLAQEFDGTAKAASATTSPAGLTVEVTYNGSASAPSATGNYAVEATVVDNNYEGSTSGTLVIAESTAEVALSNLEQGFDGSAKSVVATTTPAALAVEVTYDGSSEAPSDAGSYAVVATITEAGYTGSASATLVITPAEATISLSGLSHTYDGSAKSATSSTTPSGVSVDVTYDGSASAPTNAGSYDVVATVSDANYTGSASATLTIAKASATVTLDNLTQDHDGSAKSVSVSTDPEGLAVTLTYAGSSEAPVEIGSYPVVATIEDANYEGSASGTLTIELDEAAIPVAEAGLDQAIRPGQNVDLDGSASSDDETPSTELTYEWTFGSTPAGSAAVLAGADTATPSFVADLAGMYTIFLIVEDEDGNRSEVDMVTVSTENLAPSGLIEVETEMPVVGDSIYVNASASTDPEGDEISYSWSISSPEGSAAAFDDPASERTFFVADLAGDYEVSLTVSDLLGPNEPSSVTVTVLTAQELAEVTALEAAELVSGLGAEAVVNTRMQATLVVNLEQLATDIANGDYAAAAHRLGMLIETTDGCALRGSPDRSRRNIDWITDCGTQELLYSDLMSIQELLGAL
ncbi:immunoglobulin domain-containing protein [Pelagicoccus mobilis]|uniref:Immunoglobulin domain-containing protein n=2 Tax=Pelagicoccus mobilis TaxID=415221 RepID=A0A934S1L1_9BACT|nr:immunoglobulin domain-containing protein [Pelagicoccus mobilis]